MTFQSSASAPAGFRLGNLKISTRVFGGFAVVVSLLAGSCVVSAWNVGRIETAFTDYKQRNDIQELAEVVQREFLIYRRFVRWLTHVPRGRTPSKPSPSPLTQTRSPETSATTTAPSDSTWKG